MTLLNSCLGDKELGLCLNFEFQWQTTQFCRALALQALVECLSRNWWRFGLKVPISLNWVRFRPGIWDGGATLSTDENFSVIDKDSSQITQEAKEAIHIWRLVPNLHRNIGKMSIPHYFDPLIGAKPKHPQVGLLSQSSPSVDEVAPPSQIPGLNLTQFNEIGTFRPNLHQFLDKHSTRACRAKALQNWVVCHWNSKFKHRPSSLSPRHELSNVIPSTPHS